jgi:hypothetical protein
MDVDKSIHDLSAAFWPFVHSVLHLELDDLQGTQAFEELRACAASGGRCMVRLDATGPRIAPPDVLPDGTEFALELQAYVFRSIDDLFAGMRTLLSATDRVRAGELDECISRLQLHLLNMDLCDLSLHSSLSMLA